MFKSLLVVLLVCCITGAEAQLRCQNSNGTMLPSATVCSDQLTTCAAIFGGAVTTTSTTRPANCDLTDLQDIAVRCAKTCGICCETAAYNCLDSVYSPINCTANTRYCTNSNWTSVMASYCPATCGLCTSGSCADTITGCSAMINLCQNINWYSYMNANCARTCSVCTTSTVTTTTTASSCSNIASNCAANAALCNNSVYYSLMTTNCAATCGRCSTSTSCVNSNSNCANWVSNGFCSSSFYTTAQKKQYCARSCGLC